MLKAIPYLLTRVPQHNFAARLTKTTHEEYHPYLQTLHSTEQPGQANIFPITVIFLDRPRKVKPVVHEQP